MGDGAAREQDLAAQFDPETRTWQIERPQEMSPAETEGGFAAAALRITEAMERDGLEDALGPIVDHLLLAKGIAEVDPECRPVLLDAFAIALRDAFEHRQRNAAGDFRPDPKAARFPTWTDQREGKQQGAPRSSAKVSLITLVEDWWKEAKAAERKASTYESYRNTIRAFVAFLSHDDGARVTPEEVIRFKDYRLTIIHPRTGKPISAKTVKDSDLSGLKTIFGWAVANRKLTSNPATGITIKLGKPAKLRSKGFTDGEAQAILKAAAEVVRSGERAETAAAKRWVPWLCAYTGARVGEVAQLRKQDVRHEGGHWVARITPEAALKSPMPSTSQSVPTAVRKGCFLSTDMILYERYLYGHSGGTRGHSSLCARFHQRTDNRPPADPG
jgi:hypothetical protein